MVRHTRMLITLALGPFLILLLFGMGHISNLEIRAALVIPPDSGLEAITGDLVDQINRRAEVVETTQERQPAMEMLAGGEVDVVAVVPADAESRVQGGEHVNVEIIHNQIDPFERSVIDTFATITMENINNELWRRIVEESQAEASTAAFDHPLADDSENQVISYLIPATYGIEGMQDVGIRGLSPTPETLIGAGTLAVFLLATAWILARIRIAAAIAPGGASAARVAR